MISAIDDLPHGACMAAWPFKLPHCAAVAQAAVFAQIRHPSRRTVQAPKHSCGTSAACWTSWLSSLPTGRTSCKCFFARVWELRSLAVHRHICIYNQRRATCRVCRLCRWNPACLPALPAAPCKRRAGSRPACRRSWSAWLASTSQPLSGWPCISLGDIASDGAPPLPLQAGQHGGPGKCGPSALRVATC